MFKLIALNYSVMLKGYSQGLTIRGDIRDKDIGSISDTCLQS